MRRTTITTGLACLSAVAFPAAALADHGDGHQGDHNDHNRVERFHDQNNGNLDIGKVTSFDGHTLTISFTDGNMVTGTVDRQTQIRCEGMGDFRDHDQGSGGGNGPGDGGPGDGGPGNGGPVNGPTPAPAPAPAPGNGPGGGPGPGRGDDGQNCFAALTTGASVTEAQLDETQGGAFWDEVDLDAGFQHEGVHHHHDS
jgi:hypothetical protein